MTTSVEVSASTIAVMPTSGEVAAATGAYSARAVVMASDAGRAVARATEVTAVPTVVHAEVLSVRGMEVVSVSMIVTMSTYTVPGMCAPIGYIEVRTTEIEVVAMRITAIDAEVPVACLPVEWAIEIGGCDKGVPLPFEHDVAQIEVTTLPIGSEHIVASCHTHQVVEVDLISCLVLLVSQIQLISHLISEEEGLVAGLLVARFSLQRNDKNGSFAKDFP